MVQSYTEIKPVQFLKLSYVRWDSQQHAIHCKGSWMTNKFLSVTLGNFRILRHGEIFLKTCGYSSNKVNYGIDCKKWATQSQSGRNIPRRGHLGRFTNVHSEASRRIK